MVGTLTRVLLLVGVSLVGVCDGARFWCEPRRKEVTADGTIRVPCHARFTALFIRQTIDMMVETRECAEGFRVSGSYLFGTFDKIITPEDNALDIRLPGGCGHVTFREIRSSEDGIAFCPSFGCGLMEDPDCQVLAVNDACEGVATCAACLAEKQGCGWCYSTRRCLPRNLATPLGDGAADRCGFCDDFTADTCSSCTDDCSGHGVCTDHECVCDADWTDPASQGVSDITSCRVYSPTTESTCRAEFLHHPVLPFAPGLRDVGVETRLYQRHAARVIFRYPQQHPGTMMYVRFGKTPVVLPPLASREGGDGSADTDDTTPPPLRGYDMVFDMSAAGVDDLDAGRSVYASGGCFSSEAGGMPTSHDPDAAAIITEEIRGPALAQYGSEMWIAVARRSAARGGGSAAAGPYETPDVAVNLTIMACDKGFAGAWCEYQADWVDFYEVDTGALVNGSDGDGDGGKTATRRFAYTVPLRPRGHAHHIAFPIARDTLRLAAWVDASPARAWPRDTPLPSLQFRRNGVHVAGRDPSGLNTLVQVLPGGLGYWGLWVVSECAVVPGQTVPREGGDGGTGNVTTTALCSDVLADGGGGGTVLGDPSNEPIDVVVNVEVTACGYADPACGGARDLHVPTPDPNTPHVTELHNAPWKDDNPWLVVRVPVTPGVRELRVRTTSSLAHPPDLYLSHLVPPSVSTPSFPTPDPERHLQYKTVQADSTVPFVITDPYPGYWFVALFTPGGADAAGQAAGSFIVEMRQCAGCPVDDGAACVYGSRVVAEYERRGDGGDVAVEEREVPQYHCELPVTPAPQTGAPPTPAPPTAVPPTDAPRTAVPTTAVPTSLPTPTEVAAASTTVPPTPSPPAAAAAGPSWLLLCVGGFIGIVALGVSINLAKAYNVWRARREQQRVAGGGYGAVPPPHTTENLDDGFDADADEMTERGGSFMALDQGPPSVRAQDADDPGIVN